MLIEDKRLTAPNGDMYWLHVRHLSNDRHSGYLTRAAWGPNRAISIPIVSSTEELDRIVGRVLACSEKFTNRNTVGRPRWFDILGENVSAPVENNLIQGLIDKANGFKLIRGSKRSWMYRNLYGHFNMNSIRILGIGLSSKISLKELTVYIHDQDILCLLESLRRKDFVTEHEFLEFVDKFLDISLRELADAYNEYAKSRFGTVEEHVTATGSKYIVYLPADRKYEGYDEMYDRCRRQVPGWTGYCSPKGTKIVKLKLVDTSSIPRAMDMAKRAKFVSRLKEMMGRHKGDK